MWLGATGAAKDEVMERSGRSYLVGTGTDPVIHPSGGKGPHRSRNVVSDHLSENTMRAVCIHTVNSRQYMPGIFDVEE